MDHDRLWVALKEMDVPQYPTVLMHNLYCVQEATVRTACGETEWFPEEAKVSDKGAFLSLLFNLYTEHII